MRSIPSAFWATCKGNTRQTSNNHTCGLACSFDCGRLLGNGGRRRLFLRSLYCMDLCLFFRASLSGAGVAHADNEQNHDQAQ